MNLTEIVKAFELWRPHTQWHWIVRSDDDGYYFAGVSEHEQTPILVRNVMTGEEQPYFQPIRHFQVRSLTPTAALLSAFEKAKDATR